jgi:predicted permease
MDNAYLLIAWSAKFLYGKICPTSRLASPRPATEQNSLVMVIVYNNSGCIGVATALFEGPSPSLPEDEDTEKMTIIVMI